MNSGYGQHQPNELTGVLEHQNHRQGLRGQVQGQEGGVPLPGTRLRRLPQQLRHDDDLAPRDIVSGRRTLIKGQDVQHISVPQYEQLTIQDMLTYAKAHPAVLRALPEVEKEILKLPRAYIANVIHTIVGETFRAWVKARVDERHVKIAEERQMLIEMDP